MEDLEQGRKMPSVTDRLISLILELSEDQQRALLAELELKLSKERRRHVRESFVTVVDFASEDRSYREFIQDISEGGVFIQSSGAFSVGQEVLLTFPFPDLHKHIKIAGRIVRATDAGIGVQFKMERPLDQLSIKSILKML